MVKKRLNISRQQVRALLKKEGFNLARWNASGRVSGWGNWTGDVNIEGLTECKVVGTKKYWDRKSNKFRLTSDIRDIPIGVKVRTFKSSIKKVYDALKRNYPNAKLNDGEVVIMR